MTKYYRLLLLSFFLGLFPLACERCNSSACECDDFEHIKDFNILDMELQRVQLSSLEEVGEQSYYASDSVGFLIEVSAVEEVQRTKMEFASLFTSQMLACSPAEPHPIHRLENVRITAAEDMYYQQDSIREGEDLTDRFLFNVSYNPENRWFDLSNGSYRFSHFTQRLFIKLAQAPQEAMELYLNVYLELEDERVFTFTDQSLAVKSL